MKTGTHVLVSLVHHAVGLQTSYITESKSFGFFMEPYNSGYILFTSLLHVLTMNDEHLVKVLYGAQ